MVNVVVLVGNLTKAPEIRYTGSGLAVCTFSIAVNRGKDKTGNDRGADFPRITAYNKTAENCSRFLDKGSKVCVVGKISTGSYTKDDGTKVYTTDVIANTVEFLSSPNSQGNYQGGNNQPVDLEGIPDGFEMIDDSEIPF